MATAGNTYGLDAAAGQPPIGQPLAAQARSLNRLAKALQTAHAAQSNPVAQRIVRTVLPDGVQPLASLAAFEACCASRDDIPLMMDELLGALKSPQGAEMAKEPLARELMLAAMLAASAKYLDAVLRDPAAAASPHSLRTRSSLSAELLAVVAHDCGTWLERNRANGQLFAVNVLWDRPGLKSSEPDAAYRAWEAELLAWCDRMRSAEDLQDDILGRPVVLDSPRLQAGQMPPPGILAGRLRHVEQRHGLRPLVASKVGDAPGALDENNVVARLQIARVAHAALDVRDDHVLNDLFMQVEWVVSDLLKETFKMLDHKADSAQTAALDAAREAPLVFISYDHAQGSMWRDRIVEGLHGLPAGQLFEWTDQSIRTGDKWRGKIHSALQLASCAVLILTPGFLASKFIWEEEMPVLLQRAAADPSFVLLPVLARPCVWATRPELAELQARCVEEALNELSEGKADRQIAKLVLDARNALGLFH